MKNRARVTLLAHGTTLSGVCSATQPDATAQGPAKNVGTTCKEPLEPAPHRLLNGDEPGVASPSGTELPARRMCRK
jgi:hypothetical protein